MKKYRKGIVVGGLSLAALAMGATAYAQQAAPRGPDAKAPVTRAEHQAKATEMFARMDVNKDGKIDAADRQARVGQRFDRIDTDKNGQISCTEFAAAHGPRDRAARAEGAPKAEGKSEGRRGWGRMGHGRGHGGMGRGMMGGGMSADANKDGAITQAEFLTAATARFDRLDTNKDGTVTADERQAARKAMRDEWRQKRGAAAPAAKTGS
ncbi:MAG: EF-hand domain-containing protein [Novosphingobium sp.]|nr:EF-hand domain-containing protein [Novosphingobium sp.]